MEATKQWPDVQKLFQDGFALYRLRKHGEQPSDDARNQGKSN
jgi:hypothetical protein